MKEKDDKAGELEFVILDMKDGGKIVGFCRYQDWTDSYHVTAKGRTFRFHSKFDTREFAGRFGIAYTGAHIAELELKAGPMGEWHHWKSEAKRLAKQVEQQRRTQ